MDWFLALLRGEGWSQSVCVSLYLERETMNQCDRSTLTQWCGGGEEGEPCKGERAAATTWREHKKYEDKDAIMREVRYEMGGERKGEKENQGTEWNTNRETC